MGCPKKRRENTKRQVLGEGELNGGTPKEMEKQ